MEQVKVTEGTTEQKPPKKELKEARRENSEMLMRNMEAGTAAWQVPERVEAIGRPISLQKGMDIDRVNEIVLATAAIEKGFDDPRWIPHRQIGDAKQTVMKGEKATYIERADFYKRDDKMNKVKGEDGKPIILETPNVYITPMFNVLQIRDHEKHYPAEIKPEPIAPNLAKIEAIIKGSAIAINNSREPGEWPRYDAIADKIEMPPENAFLSKETYYAEVLHQLAHATGHEDRQNRNAVRKPMAPGYDGVPQEELRGEIASYFLRQELGLKLDPAHKDENYAQEKHIKGSVLKQDGNVYNTGFFSVVCNDANRMKNEVVKMGREIAQTIEREEQKKAPIQAIAQEKEPLKIPEKEIESPKPRIRR